MIRTALLSWCECIMRSACLCMEGALSPQWSSQHVASQRFLATLWCSRTRSPRFGHDSGAHRNCVMIFEKDCGHLGFTHSYAIIRGGCTCSALSTMAIFKNEIHNIFSANINQWFNIDGRWLAVLKIIRHPSWGIKIRTSPMRIAPKYETMLKCPY